MDHILFRRITLWKSLDEYGRDVAISSFKSDILFKYDKLANVGVETRETVNIRFLCPRAVVKERIPYSVENILESS